MTERRLIACLIALSWGLLVLEQVMAGNDFPICTAPADQRSPAISGNLVVWADQRNYPTSGRDIYGRDLSQGLEFPICTAILPQSHPSVSDNTVVWEDARNSYAVGWDYSYDIYGFDLSTGKEFPICTASGDQRDPAVSGRFVVWDDDRNYITSGLDIRGYDLLAKQEFSICANPARQGFPAISGDIVAWEDDRNYPTSGTDIYGYDLSTKTEFPICTEPGDQTSAAVSGNLVVWTDSRSQATGLDIYGFDLSTGLEFPICTAPGIQQFPAVSGNVAVWADHRNDPGDWSNMDVYGWDFSTHQEFPVSKAAGNQDQPAIYGDLVVGRDRRNSATTGSDIYGYRLPKIMQVSSVPLTGIWAGLSTPDLNGQQGANTAFSRIYTYGDSVSATAVWYYIKNGFRYDFDRWSVDGTDQPQGQRTFSAVMTANHTAVARYLTSVRTLTVQSTPVTGLWVGVSPADSSSQAGGATNFTRTYYGGTVNLGAVACYTKLGNTYLFDRWSVDGIDQPPGQRSTSVVMTANHTAVAEYVLPVWTLTVQSTPVSGIWVGVSPADKSGLANGATSFTRSYSSGAAVSLTAASYYIKNGIRYNFSRWSVDGTDQPQGQRTLSVGMTANRTAVAKYLQQ